MAVLPHENELSSNPNLLSQEISHTSGFYLLLSTGQHENSQACYTVIKESQYVFTCLAKAMLQFLISRAPVTHLLLGRAPVTTEGELWTAQAAIPLCYWWFLVGDFFMTNQRLQPVSGIVFPDFDSQSHGLPCCSVNEHSSWSRLAQHFVSSSMFLFWSLLLILDRKLSGQHLHW